MSSMMRRIVVLVAPLIVACACNASYPTQPSAPTAVGLQLHVRNPLGRAIVGNSYGFTAYALRSDTAWEDVTAKAEWRSSNIGILRSPVSGSSFVATSPGTASVLVRYEGQVQSLDVEVIASSPQHRPRLSVDLFQGLTVGGTASLRALFFPASGSTAIVTADAAWESSDPGIVTVDRGTVRGIAPGTATIAATHQGMSDFLRISVAPAR
jgi:hypothetical protein